MYNLIGNSIKFTDLGEIKISAIVKNPFIHITVSDTGVGISKDKQDIIFDAFEQADSSISRNYGGTGLGLAITKSLVELHGGAIRVNSENMKGANFIFSLPLYNKDTSNLKNRPHVSVQNLISEFYNEKEIIVKENGNNKSNNDIRILVVDDEPINIQIIYNILSVEKYDIVSAKSGEEALNLILGNEKFDII